MMYKISGLFLMSMVMITTSVFSQNVPNSKRMLLSQLRGGDYAHPGDGEAIEIIFQNLDSNSTSGNILDLGCGFGGTLNYIMQKGFQKLYGIDIDPTAIAYGKSKYKSINFYEVDALKSSTLFPDVRFSLMLCISSLYAIQDKKKVFEELSKTAIPGATLVIFDYSSLQEDALQVRDFAGKEMYPVQIDKIVVDLESAGWDVVQTQDISLKFIKWYGDFLAKLSGQKDSLLAKFTQTDIDQVDQTFSYFLTLLKEKKLGGVLIYARKNK